MDNYQRNEALGLSARRRTFKANQDLKLAASPVAEEKKYDSTLKNETFAAEGPKITEEESGEPQKPKTKVLYSNRAS